MRLGAPVLVALVMAVGVLGLVISTGRLAESRAELSSLEESLGRAVHDAQRVIELRQREQRVAENKRPQQDVIARVNDTLAEAGIPQARFAGLRPQSDTALPGTGQRGPLYRRQVVQISVWQLTIGQLGSFLGAWRASQELWTPTRIELTHVRGPASPAHYNLAMLISTTYVADR